MQSMQCNRRTDPMNSPTSIRETRLLFISRALTASALAGFFGITMMIVASKPGAASPPAGYTLTWSEEFDEGAGNPPDPTLWSYELGGGGWGNGELQTYVSDIDHSSIISDVNATDGQALQITATDDNGGI